MKTKTMLLLAAMAIALSSCLVKSLHPFYTNKSIVFKQNMLGTFIDQDSSTWEFSQLSHHKGLLHGDTGTLSYKVKYVSEDGDSSFLIATLFELKKNYYVDFFPFDTNDDETLTDWHRIPVHSLARILIWGRNNATFFWYNEDWLNDLFEKNRIKISHEVIQTGVYPSQKAYILTASSAELQKFIRKYGEQQDILKNIDQKKIRDNEDKDFVYTTINNYLENTGDKNGIGGSNLLMINLKRTDK